MKARIRSIHRQVLLFTFLATGLVVATVGSILFFQHLSQTRAHLADGLRTTSRIIAANASAALAFRDHGAAAHILGALRFDPLIVSAALYDPDGRLFVSTGTASPAVLAASPVLPPDAILLDVTHQGEVFGRLLVITSNRAELRRTTITWATAFTAALAFAAILAFLLAHRFQHAIAAPLVNLARTARDVTTRRDYSVRVRPAGPDEIVALANAFNTMLHEVGQRDEALARQLVALDGEIKERRAAQESLRQNTREMLRLSHAAGMAEVATGVLHNIGNALNSINVSAELLADRLAHRARPAATALRDFFQNPAPEAATLLATPPAGPRLRSYASDFASHLDDQLDQSASELASLRSGVTHLKEIVSRQQTLAKPPRQTEAFQLSDALKDALDLDKTTTRLSPVLLQIEITTSGGTPPLLHSDRAAIIQILVNLLANAREALTEAAPPAPAIHIQIGPASPTHLPLSIRDNGIGIPRDRLPSLFTYGQTTKPHGHGFGLHNSANTARLLGGALHARSDGPRQGATFTLEIPLTAPIV